LNTPPSAVRTLRDLIYWQYAKIISGSAGIGKSRYGFVMNRFKKLQSEEIFWNSIREYVKEREVAGRCAFCDSTDELSLEHLFPRHFGGPDDEKNVMWVCRKCNSSKDSKRPYEYWTTQNGLEAAKYEMPRLVEGKYLKFLYETLSKSAYLDFSIEKIRDRICPKCDIASLCETQDTFQKLSPLCLDGAATVALRST
jgi:hypothetical protein